jgi:glutamate racemase
LSAPIGIFDSGVGGLTVAAAIKRLMPNEQLIYFGDTLHAPYGDKSEENIIRYSEGITEFLLKQGCKSIVIACNTASSLAYKPLKTLYPDLLIENVIDPVVNYVGRNINSKIGIIGTRATIKSGVYRKRLRRLNPHLHVVTAPAPLLVGIVEEGFTNTQISKGAIEAYLGNKKFSDISSLILGCTHFPLLQKEIESYYGGRAEVVDSPELVAHHLRLELKKQDLLSDNPVGEDHFIISEKTDNFNRIARMFFGQEIKLEELNIWH